VVFWSRLPLIIFPVLTAWLVWLWGRQLFSPAVGLLLALLFAVEPTALGHGALFKNDLAATFAYLFFAYRAWMYWREPGVPAGAWLGLALLFSILAKMSLLFLVPVAPAIIALRYLTAKGSIRIASFAIVLCLLIPYAGTLAACQFQTRRLPAAELHAYAQDSNVPRIFLFPAHIFRVLPLATPIWNGSISLLHSDATDSPVYLFGQKYANGHPLYFLLALAVKVPAGLQILVLLGVVALAGSLLRGHLGPQVAFWGLPPLVYIGLASISSLQFGVRLILPALPFGLFLAGAALYRWRRGIAMLVPLLLVAWVTVQSARAFPHGISFFNRWAGGPANGIRYLADSNIDWGQDLGEVAEFARENHIAKLRLSYFGNDSPFRYFSEDRVELIAPPWSDDLAKGTHLEPEPGYYAISVNLLPGHLFEQRYRDYYRAFRTLEPIGRAGYSILIYRVDSSRDTAGVSAALQP
jgi:hypothetical protein